MYFWTNIQNTLHSIPLLRLGLSDIQVDRVKGKLQIRAEMSRGGECVMVIKGIHYSVFTRQNGTVISLKTPCLHRDILRLGHKLCSMLSILYKRVPYVETLHSIFVIKATEILFYFSFLYDFNKWKLQTRAHTRCLFNFIIWDTYRYTLPNSKWSNHPRDDLMPGTSDRTLAAVFREGAREPGWYIQTHSQLYRQHAQ